jgi:hypothetical protein
MEIDQHVNSIVQNIVAQITDQVQTAAMAAIEQKINDVISAIDTTSIIANRVNEKLDIKLSQLPIDSKSIEAVLKTRVDDLANNLYASVQTQSMDMVRDSITAQVGRIDFNQLCEGVLLSAIKNSKFELPANSVNPDALVREGLLLTGDNIAGGIIRNFGSTGIDDRATTCQLSVFDDVTVVENNLVTRDLTVKGTTTIEGDLNVTGTMPESSPLFQNVVRAASNIVRGAMDQVVFGSYADLVFDRIKTDGLDLTRITVNGQEVVNGGILSSSITASNLQQVGQLKELQVAGETLLSGTLYTTKTRVGVNTIEPAQALSVWDQEIEIGFGKQSNNVAVIGTPRPHALVLSSNGKNNITLTPEGAVAINQLAIGDVTLTSGTTPPSDNRPKGSIVLNANPSLGGPIGWVSLGEARWANFGIID